MAKNSTLSHNKNATTRGHCHTSIVLKFIHRELTICHKENKNTSGIHKMKCPCRYTMIFDTKLDVTMAPIVRFFIGKNKLIMNTVYGRPSIIL